MSTCLLAFYLLCGGRPTEQRIVTAYAAAATFADVWSTQRVLDDCPACREANPVLAPVMEHGKPLAYAAGYGLSLVNAYTTDRLRQSGSKWWWVPSVAVTGSHYVAITFNMRLHDRER